ncbi:HIV Tat-specific factor 1, partial [Tremellales sp. Uapishka_1]
MPSNAPTPDQFNTDHRVHYDKTAGKFQYEDVETGQEFEWTGKVWVPLVDEELWKAQQAAYSVKGVDENTPAAPVLAREEKRNKKRKKDVDYTTNASERAPVASSSTASKPQQPPSAPKQTAVYVTNLPPTTTPSLLASVFSKAGVLLIGDDGEPRVKMYYDDDEKFKGDALVMYFKEGSVDLAIRLLDDTELELGGGYGNMRVKVAEYARSAGGQEKKKKQKVEDKTDSAGADAGDGNGNGNGKADKEKRKATHEEKQKMSRRIKTMQKWVELLLFYSRNIQLTISAQKSKLTWHSDSDSDDPAAPSDGAPLPGASRFNRVVVLKGMFTLAELERDSSLLLELVEEVRDEANTLGEVTSVILYDKEEDGVMTVKFKEQVSAQACIVKMNGRFFDGRRISAALYTGRERFEKSGKGDLDDEEEGQRARLDNFARWLVDGDEQD